MNAPQLNSFVSHRLFEGSTGLYVERNPYRRPLWQQTADDLDFSRALGESEQLCYSALVAHRILLTIYETNSVLLPAQGLGTLKRDYDEFYAPAWRTMGASLRPMLERHVFGFLADAITVSGHWTRDALRAYFDRAIEDGNAAPNEVAQAIEATQHPDVAADSFLIQLALDGLTEASAMSRTLGGAYGPEQSELFKIFIDEFGYGVHEAKHSRLFENLLKSRGMLTDVHSYWSFYLTGPTAVNNYFYYVVENGHFFRYVGAVTFIESIFAKGFADTARTLQRVFGSAVDTRYCDEHAHIDKHHGRMTFEHLLLPLADKHGDEIIPELVRGLEEVRLLLRLADDDLIAQLRWADQAAAHPHAARAGLAGTNVTLARGAPFATRTFDEDRLLVMNQGELDLVISGTGSPLRVRAGEAALIARQRLHGLQAATESCTFSLESTAELRQ
jgi:quercetin dioxygenase-like cupin family protein